eukprot:comp12792_c0_seq1/m.7932 comp12792_c0_seq1/g.7932  ORF comp12792_c0_seq1/g.7932 comp12792_c0_seq1/m.7932 type:complete len:187 (-) comp12792_c0_seq1:638-1198(-)
MLRAAAVFLSARSPTCGRMASLCLPRLVRLPQTTPLLACTRWRHVHSSAVAWPGSAAPGGEANTLQLNSVQKYSHRGFAVAGRFYLGPVVVFPKHVLAWKVSRWQDITPETLSVFALTEPKPEIVVLGLGSSTQRLPPSVYQWFKDQGIRVEICDTRIGCQQFNHLIEGGWRQVAAGLLPIDPPPQ